jgi:hypothetical protein
MYERFGEGTVVRKMLAKVMICITHFRTASVLADCSASS